MCVEIVEQTWEKTVAASRVFKVKQKLKWCEHSFIKWRKKKKYNTRNEIDLLLKEIEHMQTQESDRNWERWRQLKAGVDAAYKAEENIGGRSPESIGSKREIITLSFSMLLSCKEEKGHN